MEVIGSGCLGDGRLKDQRGEAWLREEEEADGGMEDLWEIGEEREACGAFSRCQERRGGNVAEQGEAGTG